MQRLFVLLFGGLAAAGFVHAAPAVIVPQPADAPPSLVTFAAREVQRYVHVRTGVLLPVTPADPARESAIVLAVDPDLGRQTYRLRTRDDDLFITGGSEVAVLYGAYAFAEKLGVRFEVQGDVIPDGRIELNLPALDETRTPLFEHRGIQPFHDFTEGPDWWSLDDYRTIIGQLPKLRMNWIGFHCYPEGGVGPEALVWIGLPEDVNPDGTVRWAYPSRWASTSGGTFGYGPAKTSEFAAGAGLLFPGDDFGSPVTVGHRPIPTTLTGSIEVFNRAGRFLRAAFGLAQRLGVHTVVGTETPLKIPSALQERLREKGLDPAAPDTVRKLYEGMFLRIKRAHPLGTYWLWTPENWTWGGNTQEQIEATLADFRAALDALAALDHPFGFGTCGWVLGPSQDRSLFDRWLPRDAAVACINQQVGFSPVEPGFVRIQDRPQWAIPWVEDDPAMILPQLWAGRMRRDAADAYAYGCTGLLGIHWRTRILSPNFGALAAAAWDQQGWNPEPGVRFAAPAAPSNDIRLGGKRGTGRGPIAGTDEDAVYRVCRYHGEGYRVRVPNGVYTVTLKFCEIAYDQPGKRVFGVRVQDREVVRDLDVFARAGKNVAYDVTIPDVRVTDETLKIDFVRQVEFPFLAGIVIDGRTAAANQIASRPFQRRINCGGGAVAGYEADLPDAGAVPVERNLPRDLPIADFYADWCTAQFGPEAAPELAALFTRLDGGGPDVITRSTRGAHLPRPATWIAGPGGIVANRKPWAKEQARYAFVDELAALRPQIRGAGNLARFDYWLNSFRYLRAVGKIGCTRGALDAAMQRLAQAPTAGERRQLAEQALAMREQLARDWERMITLQLAAVETVGELGTLANLEQHVRRNPRDGGKHRFLDHHDAALARALGRPLPPTVHPTTNYLGRPRLIVPTQRGSRAPDETLAIQIIVLDREPPQALTLRWRPLGARQWRPARVRHLGRAVWQGELPPAPEEASVEYQVRAVTAGGVALQWPPGPPQTVVVMPAAD